MIRNLENKDFRSKGQIKTVTEGPFRHFEWRDQIKHHENKERNRWNKHKKYKKSYLQNNVIMK